MPPPAAHPLFDAEPERELDVNGKPAPVGQVAPTQVTDPIIIPSPATGSVEENVVKGVT